MFLKQHSYITKYAKIFSAVKNITNKKPLSNYKAN